MHTYPIALGMFKPPGAFGVDIATAEGQPLGVPLTFGGAYVGLFTTKQRYIRQLPGRIIGKTTDTMGRTGYTLTLQTREQHIRRERATSNICTSTQLIGLMVAVYCATMGPGGLRQVAELSYHKAHYLANAIDALPSWKVIGEEGSTFFNEFPVQCPIVPAEVNRRLAERGIIGGLDVSACGSERYALLRHGDEQPRRSRSAHRVVERHKLWSRGMSKDVMPNASVADMPDRSLLMDRSVPGRKAINLPAPDVPISEMPDDGLLRETDDLRLPEVSQLDVIRYFTLLSRLNFSIDTNFYPLGSCTMKYNPKLNDQMASLGGFANIHPSARWRKCARCAGSDVRFAGVAGGGYRACPEWGWRRLAGAQGEYAGLVDRSCGVGYAMASRTADVALIPDSAHGTNPASAAMAGLSVVTVKTDEAWECGC